MEPGVTAAFADLSTYLGYEGNEVRLEEWGADRARWMATMLDGTRRPIRVAPWNLEAISPPA